MGNIHNYYGCTPIQLVMFKASDSEIPNHFTGITLFTYNELKICRVQYSIFQDFNFKHIVIKVKRKYVITEYFSRLFEKN